MPSDCISYKKSGYFTTLITDYLDQKSSLQPFYNKFPTIENFEAQIIEKSKNFNCDENYTADAKRKILISVIEQQYKNIEISSESKGNISLLQQATTFTITTGHQLNLFTGPLYFLYKIISTINLTKELKQAYPSYNFVPIYWMATEDHDFEEINYFKYKGSKLKWDKEAAGPVGRLSTTGLELLFETFALKLGMGVNADKLKNLFKKSYLEHTNLADATRFIANELFGEFGLISIDADNQDLKRSFSSFIKEELLRQIAHKKVLESIASLKKYTIQVNPREINLFYIEDNVRERIILENGIYKVNTTQISFSEDEILAAVANNPEKFSPNVIMRPLYQEVILPNLCYIGGGGEIAYWLELKAYFDEMKITFPMLLVRNSAVLLNENQIKKIDKLGLSWADLFSNQKELLTKKTKELSQFPIDLTVQKDFLRKQFQDLFALVQLTDKSFLGAVKAQEAKQSKGLENLEKKLLRAQKKKFHEILNRIIDIQDLLFPNQSLQERQINFSEFYLEYGSHLIPVIMSELKPLEHNFTTVLF